MKRGIIAVGMLTIILISAITVNFSLIHKADALHTLAQYAIQDKKALENLDTEWEKQIIYFELFTDRSYFESLDKKIKKLSYIDGENYRITCTEAMLEIAALQDHISFTFSGIF